MRGRVWIERSVLSRVRLLERCRAFIEDLPLEEELGRSGEATLGQVVAVVVSGDAHSSIVERVRTLRRSVPRAKLWLATTHEPPLRAATLPALARVGLDDWYPISKIGENDRLANDILGLAVLAPALGSTSVLAAGPDKHTSLAAALVTFCSRNADRRLTAEKVADWFGEHRRSVDRWLVAEKGLSASMWIRGERHRLARRLRENGYSLGTLAECLGYAGPSGPQMLLARNTGSPGYDLDHEMSQSVVAPCRDLAHPVQRVAQANPEEDSS